MNKQSQIANRKSQILVVGAGPAGASLAIRLAEKGFAVTLVEREKFPRHKLCGEFVSPECFAHFRELQVIGEMIAAGGERIAETVFYEPGGRHVSVASEWFNGDRQGALGISRAEMDLRILERAKAAGVRVLEETQTVGLLSENGKICGVKAKMNGAGKAENIEIAADLTIDATGRANVLGKLAGKSQIADSRFQIPDSRLKAETQKPKIKNRKSKLIGFKAHLENVHLEKNRCEIYFFRGGYGGLNYVENGAANHCFLIKADVVKEFGGRADKIVENVIFQNKRAFKTMKDAETIFDWLAVSVEGFGRQNLNPAPNLFSVGDAAAFIDPFTGSGMLMALESAKILAKIAAENRFSPERIAPLYETAHREKFQNRLRVCALMRRAAFVPHLAKLLITGLGFSSKSREFLARATRQSFLFNKNK